MPTEDARMFPNIITPNNPVILDEEICKCCDICADICVMDILMPNPPEPYNKPPVGGWDVFLPEIVKMAIE